MIDTHAHLNFTAFRRDYEEVIARSFDNGIKGIINIGSNFATSQRACKIAQEFEKAKIGIFAAVGLHPLDIAKPRNELCSTTGDKEKFQKEKYEELINKNKNYVKAIGEIGIDYFYSKKEEVGRRQKETFVDQLDLAQKFALPIIVHSRNGEGGLEKSYTDILKILDDFSLKGVIHCFSANWQTAKEFLKRGFYLGFNGIITFPNFRHQEVVKNTPSEKILLETDCPYLAPQAVRGSRNEPRNLFYIAQEVAKIKGESLTKIIKQTDQNAKNLFVL